MPTEPDPEPGPTADPDEIAALAFKVWGYKQGEAVSLMIHLGERLSLYRALDARGATRAADLAAETGLDKRWLHEWLQGQAAAGLLDRHEDGSVELSPAGSAVLADDQNSLRYAAGAFAAGPPGPEIVDGLAEAFRTGIGLSFDQRGPQVAHQTEQLLGPWARLALVPRILPALRGVTAKLEQGARVADVGCGGGTALRAIAAAYPASRYDGYDSSAHAIELANAHLDADPGVAEHLEFHFVDGSELPHEPTFDLVLSFDCLHDMTDPQSVAGAIRRAIKPDGTWLIKDIRCADTWEGNRKNPMLAMFYGFSIAGCLASSSSEPGGAALGTLGLPPGAMAQLCSEAGFEHFEMHDFDDPANLYYEVRP